MKRSTDKPQLGFDRDEISRAIRGQGYCDQGQKIQGINDARDQLEAAKIRAIKVQKPEIAMCRFCLIV
jgi:hypothetical protein